MIFIDSLNCVFLSKQSFSNTLILTVFFDKYIFNMKYILISYSSALDIEIYLLINSLKLYLTYNLWINYKHWLTSSSRGSVGFFLDLNIAEALDILARDQGPDGTLDTGIWCTEQRCWKTFAGSCVSAEA